MRTLFSALVLLALCPPAAQAATGDPRAVKVVDAFLDAYDAVQTFRGKVRVETRKAGNVQVTRSELFLAKPASTALRIVEAPDMRAAEGTKMVWFGDANVQVVTRFFGFPIRARPRYDDPRLLGQRGWHMRDLSIVSVEAMLKDRRTRAGYVGADTVLGRPATVIEVKGPRLLRGCDSQRLWFDDRTDLPLAIEAYDGAERAFRIELEPGFAFDQKLPSDTFTID